MTKCLESPRPLRRWETKAWVEEAIWGHRFYNDQTPWLLLCELLAICADRARNGTSAIFPGLADGGHEDFHYRLPRRGALRHLLFRDRYLADSESIAASDASMWQDWLAKAKQASDFDFSYLQGRFASFDALRNAVELLRSAEIEPQRRRRWTSRHLVPQGPDMLLADYRETRSGSDSLDRRFFARGGELLFLMLNRSGRTAELEPLLRRRLLDANNRWNLLARQLQPAPDARGSDKMFDTSIGYLPMADHRAYRRLAEDWCRVLRLAALPDDSRLEPLMRLSGLAVVLYLTERACEELGRPMPALPLDMLSGETRALRKLSAEHLALHRQLAREAIDHRIDSICEKPEWRTALTSGNPARRAKELIAEIFVYDNKTGDRQDPERQLDELRRAVFANYDNHLGLVLGFYAEQIGLAVARRGVGRWYAASDGLLEALVLANVDGPVELGQFLMRLFERYRILVGPEAARSAFESLPIPLEQFKLNERRFEERLRVLGLAQRLSDDCAFVINPYHASEARAA
jgi:hypothetical protein